MTGGWNPTLLTTDHEGRTIVVLPHALYLIRKLPEPGPIILVHEDLKVDEGIRYPATVLMSVSDHFYKLVMDNPNNMYLRGFRYSLDPRKVNLYVFHHAMELAVNGQTHLSPYCDLVELVAAANFLEMRPLKAALVETYKKLGNLESSMKFFLYKSRHGDPGLYLHAKKKLTTSFQRAIETLTSTILKEMTADNWVDILSDKDLFIWEEDMLFGALVSWVVTDFENRQGHVNNLFGLIRKNCLDREACLDFAVKNGSMEMVQLIHEMFKIPVIRSIGDRERRTIDVLLRSDKETGALWYQSIDPYFTGLQKVCDKMPHSINGSMLRPVASKYNITYFHCGVNGVLVQLNSANGLWGRVTELERVPDCDFACYHNSSIYVVWNYNPPMSASFDIASFAEEVHGVRVELQSGSVKPIYQIKGATVSSLFEHKNKLYAFVTFSHPNARGESEIAVLNYNEVSDRWVKIGPELPAPPKLDFCQTITGQNGELFFCGMDPRLQNEDRLWSLLQFNSTIRHWTPLPLPNLKRPKILIMNKQIVGMGVNNDLKEAFELLDATTHKWRPVTIPESASAGKLKFNDHVSVAKVHSHRFAPVMPPLPEIRITEELKQAFLKKIGAK